MPFIPLWAVKALGFVTGSKTAMLVAGAVLALFAFFTWHHFDKSSAVKLAISGLLQNEETAFLKATLAEEQRRRVIIEQANGQLTARIVRDEVTRLGLNQRIKDYENLHAINPDCSVDQRLIDVMRRQHQPD